MLVYGLANNVFIYTFISFVGLNVFEMVTVKSNGVRVIEIRSRFS